MKALSSQLDTWLDSIRGLASATEVPQALLVLGLGVILSMILAHRLSWPGASLRALFWARLLVRYSVLIASGFLALRVLGVELSVLLGAAGVLTVGVGIASQTAASNLISSLFLLGEQPFSVGDYIRVGDSFGEVVSIDALSVKLRTFDNVLIRIPNETLLKTSLINTTRYPIRRVDVVFEVDPSADLSAVEALLLELADKNPRCLEEPAPLVYFQKITNAGVELKFMTWTQTDLFFEVGSELVVQTKRALDEAGVEIAASRVSLKRGLGRAARAPSMESESD